MNNFRTFYGKPIGNVIDYIKNYLETHENIEILVGSDSQRYGKKIVYGVVIVLYTKGRGGHVICKRETQDVEPVLPVKLINEVWKSLEVAEHLRLNGIPLVSFIDIDLNPDPKFKSNATLRSAVGRVEGMGYRVRHKHNGALATYAADHLVRH